MWVFIIFLDHISLANFTENFKYKKAGSRSLSSFV